MPSKGRNNTPPSTAGRAPNAPFGHEEGSRPVRCNGRWGHISFSQFFRLCKTREIVEPGDGLFHEGYRRYRNAFVIFRRLGVAILKEIARQDPMARLDARSLVQPQVFRSQ